MIEIHGSEVKLVPTVSAWNIFESPSKLHLFFGEASLTGLGVVLPMPLPSPRPFDLQIQLVGGAAGFEPQVSCFSCLNDH